MAESTPTLEEPEELLEEAEDDPQITQLKGLRRPINWSAVMTTGIFLLLLFYFLYFAKELLLPIVLAMMLNLLLGPLVRYLQRFRIPRPISTAVLLVSIGTLLFVGAYSLSGPTTRFIKAVPDRLQELEDDIKGYTEPVQEAAETAERLEEGLNQKEEGTETAVVPKGPSIVEVGLGYAQSIGIGILATVTLLSFLLALDEIFLHKMVKVLPTFHDKKLAVEVVREIERDVSSYLMTVTMVNAGLGMVTGLAMYLIGVPDPLLWGVMIGCLNYIPYLGPFIGIIILAFVGLVSFDSLGRAILPPFVFLGLNLTEAYFVTPYTLGRRLDLNPVMIILFLAFWGFVWGTVGMILAVPLLVTLKIICDHFEPLEGFGEFLAGPDRQPAGKEGR